MSIQIFLRFPNAQEANAILHPLGFVQSEESPNATTYSGHIDGIRYDVDILGVLREPSGTMLTNAEGEEFPELVNIPGWHINILWWSDDPETIPDLSAYVITPVNPQRTFAD